MRRVRRQRAVARNRLRRNLVHGLRILVPLHAGLRADLLRLLRPALMALVLSLLRALLGTLLRTLLRPVLRSALGPVRFRHRGADREAFDAAHFNLARHQALDRRQQRALFPADEGNGFAHS